MKPGHPTFHFGTCYTKLLHRMSFYSSLNSVICHCFQTSRIVSSLKFLFSCNLGAFEHDQVTIPSLPTQFHYNTHTLHYIFHIDQMLTQSTKLQIRITQSLIPLINKGELLQPWQRKSIALRSGPCLRGFILPLSLPILHKSKHYNNSNLR